MSLTDTADLLASLATFFGLPFGFYSYWRVKLKEQRDRELGTYDVLDQNYRSFLAQCFDNLHLGVYDPSQDFDESALTPENRIKREILLLNLISILERAYLLHLDRSKAMERQWQGWEQYIDCYCRSSSFVRSWREVGSQFERDFVIYIEERISRYPLSKKANLQ